MTPPDPYISIRTTKTIERHILFPLRESSADQTIIEGSGDGQVQCDRVHPEVVAWYKPLSNKSVQSLQLHRSSSLITFQHQYFVAVVLGDGSILRLHGSGSESQKTRREHHRLGIARNVSDPNELLPETLIMNIDIAHNSSVDQSAVDMRFILAVCHGIHHSSNSPPSDNKLFALALTACVARKCLRVDTDVRGKTKTPLDDLWQGAHSPLPGVGESLWEDKIAEETRRKVHKLVFKSATEQVMRRLSSLPGTEVLGSRAGEKNAGGGNLAENNAAPQPDPSSSPDTDKRSNAASIVAWVESAAQKRQAVQLEIWDDKWDKAWKKRWSETWESGWSKLALLKVTPRGVGKIGKLGELLAVVGTASADGKISGRTAGRVPIDASLVSRTLEHPATPGPVTNISRNNKTKEADHALPKPKDIPPVQLEDWRSERYPTLHQKWAPVWQTASDMAWKSIWGKAECAGKEKAVELMKSYNPPEKPPATEGVASAQSKRPKTEAKSKTKPPEQGVLTPEVNSGPRSAQLGKIVATVVVKMRQTKRDGTRRKQEPRGSQYEKELEVETKVKDSLLKHPPHMPPGLATKLAEHAWSEAKLIPGSAEAGLDEWAKHALQSTRRLDSVLPYLAKLMPLKHQGGTEDIWEKVFASTWETTWKRSWEAAWAAVWEESAKDAWEKGVQEGIDIALEEKLPNDWSATLSETGKSSYRQLNASLEGTKSYMDTLWNIRSNFEALTQLHDALHHSVPTYHEGAMEIKISPKRNLYTAISKKLELTEAESQVPRKSTHVDLQTDIKQLINPDTIAQMSKIWAIATDVYQDLNFLPNDQDSEKNLETKPNDRSARLEHPGSQPASEPILSSAKTAEVDIPSIETVAKIQEQ